MDFSEGDLRYIVYRNSLDALDLTSAGCDSVVLVRESVVTELRETGLCNDHDTYPIERVPAEEYPARLSGLPLCTFYGVDGVNNPAQVGDFLQKLDDGMTYEELLHHSLDAVFGDSRDGAALVGHFYRSVVGEDAPDEVINHYASLVDNGELSPFDLSLIASEHELNLANIDLVGLSQSGVEFV